jgi:hypothetical protein
MGVMALTSELRRRRLDATMEGKMGGADQVLQKPKPRRLTDAAADHRRPFGAGNMKLKRSAAHGAEVPRRAVAVMCLLSHSLGSRDLQIQISDWPTTHRGSRLKFGSSECYVSQSWQLTGAGSNAFFPFGLGDESNSNGQIMGGLYFDCGSFAGSFDKEGRAILFVLEGMKAIADEDTLKLLVRLKIDVEAWLWGSQCEFRIPPSESKVLLPCIRKYKQQLKNLLAGLDELELSKQRCEEWADGPGLAGPAHQYKCLDDMEPAFEASVAEHQPVIMTWD